MLRKEDVRTIRAHMEFLASDALNGRGSGTRDEWITATYVASFLAFAFVRSVVTGHPFLSEAAPITGPMYQLFIFFMITDPKTTVRSFRGQCLVAFLVAVVEAVFRLLQFVHAPYYSLFIVGPVANLVEIAMQRRRRPVDGSAFSRLLKN